MEISLRLQAINEAYQDMPEVSQQHQEGQTYSDIHRIIKVGRV
jgi:hypothetical protein